VVGAEEVGIAVGELLIEGHARGSRALDDVADGGVRVSVRGGVSIIAQEPLALVGSHRLVGEVVGRRGSRSI
jgi:hypothetical protein